MRTLVLDCGNICHITRYAFGSDLTWQEEQTGILFGFFSMMLRLAKRFETNRFMFAWDSRKSFRRLDYPPYKANRRSAEPLTEGQRESEARIYAQFDKLRKELLPALGFKNVFHFTGWEADDIVAVLVEDRHRRGHPPEDLVVVSTDKDLYQLLDYCVIFRPLKGKSKELITRDSFQREYGITPDLWLTVKAWAGDSGDNVSGVEGVGIKTAIKHIAGNLPESGKIRERINDPANRAIYERNMRLLRVPYPGIPDRHVEIKVDVGEDSPISLDVFIDMCERYGFSSFLKTEALEEWKTRFNMR